MRWVRAEPGWLIDIRQAGEGRLCGDQGLEPCHHFLLQLIREPGTDLAGIFHSAILKNTDQQGTKGLGGVSSSLCVNPPITTSLAFVELYLSASPCSGSPGDKGCRLFSNNAFESHFTCRFEESSVAEVSKFLLSRMMPCSSFGRIWRSNSRRRDRGRLDQALCPFSQSRSKT